MQPYPMLQSQFMVSFKKLFVGGRLGGSVTWPAEPPRHPPSTLLNAGDGDRNSALACPLEASSLGTHGQAQELSISNMVCVFLIHFFRVLMVVQEAGI